MKFLVMLIGLLVISCEVSFKQEDLVIDRIKTKKHRKTSATYYVYTFRLDDELLHFRSEGENWFIGDTLLLVKKSDLEMNPETTKKVRYKIKQPTKTEENNLNGIW